MNFLKKYFDKKKEKKFDALEAVSREAKVPPTPPDEFEKIITEMDKRKIVPKIRKELHKK